MATDQVYIGLWGVCESEDGEVTQCTFVVKAQAFSVLLPPVGVFLGVVENGCLNRIEQNPLAIYMSMIGLGVDIIV